MAARRQSSASPTAAATVEVTYVGILPDLFREGQGVVTLGTLQADGTFRASEVLAKHDETYMPKDVADALKKSGHWNPASGPPPPAATWNTMQSGKTGGWTPRHSRASGNPGPRLVCGPGCPLRGNDGSRLPPARD